MNFNHLHLRRHDRNGYLVLTDALEFQFYIRRSRTEIGAAVLRSLETFRHAVGVERLETYCDPDDAPEYEKRLDARAWQAISERLLDPRPRPGYAADLQQRGNPLSGCFARCECWWLEYHAVETQTPDRTSCVHFRLPTEYLEEHGPQRVRELALELAGDLPFNSGFVNLSLFTNAGVRVAQDIEELRFRYLGLNVHDGGLYMSLGHRINGVHWLNFLGQPVLGQLGGMEGLRARLPSPDIDIQELSGDRVLISLGERPQLGDVQAGESLPTYRALARVYEPYLYHEELLTWENKSLPRWERRFLG